jgi:hypothetical protein
VRKKPCREFPGVVLRTDHVRGKRALALIWNRASWPLSATVKRWLHAHGQQVKSSTLATWVLQPASTQAFDMHWLIGRNGCRDALADRSAIARRLGVAVRLV